MKKRMSLISMLLIGTLMTAALTGCGKDASETNNRESINQVSLLQGLTFGDYNGSLSAKEVKALGDTGIGTFDGLNGELVMLDGVIYRAAGDGSVEAVPDTETIPFCDVTFFDNDKSQSEEKPFFHRLHEIAEVIAETLGCKTTSVSVAIKDIPEESWKEQVWDKSIVPDDQYLYKRPEYNCD